MSWASQRRFTILLILGAVVAAFVAILSMTVFYKAPSCSDNIQNQGETGIDCGGPCPYLCTEQQRPPTVLFTKAVSSGTGRTDIVASIENANTAAAAKDVPYTVTLYSASRAIIQTVTGTVDLPPSTTVPVFMLGVASGKQAVASAFLTIDPNAPRWFTMTTDTRVKPTVSNIVQGGTVDAPRIDAVLTNPTSVDITNVQAIVLVHDAQNEVMTASQTILPVIPAQGQVTATFTWNSAFPSVPAAIEVIPVIPL